MERVGGLVNRVIGCWRIAVHVLLGYGGVTMAQPQLEQRVIEAAKDVDRLWRDVGPYHPHMSTALALLSRSISKLKVWREGRREEEEAIQERW